MVGTLITLVSAIFALAGKIFDFLYQKQLVDAGRTEQQLADLKAQVDAAHQAVMAKASIDADVAVHGERVPDDDPFLRD